MEKLLVVWLAAAILIQFAFIETRSFSRLAIAPPGAVEKARQFHIDRQYRLVQLVLFFLVSAIFLQVGQHLDWPTYCVILLAELCWLLGWYLQSRWPEKLPLRYINFLLSAAMALASGIGALSVS